MKNSTRNINYIKVTQAELEKFAKESQGTSLNDYIKATRQDLPNDSMVIADLSYTMVGASEYEIKSIIELSDIIADFKKQDEEAQDFNSKNDPVDTLKNPAKGFWNTFYVPVINPNVKQAPKRTDNLKNFLDSLSKEEKFYADIVQNNPEYIQELKARVESASIDLSKANLEGARLQNTIIHGEFKDAKLAGVDMSFSYLKNVTISDSDLSNAHFLNTVAENTKFENCTYKVANLQKAQANGILPADVKLEGGVLKPISAAKIEYVEASLDDLREYLKEVRVNENEYKHLSKKEFIKLCAEKSQEAKTFNEFIKEKYRRDVENDVEVIASLAGQDISKAIDLRGGNFTKSNLAYCNLDTCLIDGVVFDEACLEGISMKYTNASKVSFVDANLMSANLSDGTLLDKANFTRANMERASFFQGNLSKAKMNFSNCYGANFDTATMNKVEALGAVFDGGNLTNADLREFKAKHASFKNAVMNGVSALDADFENAIMEGVKAIKADFTGSNLKNAGLKRSDLTRSILNKVDLSSANLEEAILAEVKANRANFEKAILEKVNARFADLTEANLTDVKARYSDFTKATLEAAKAERADLEGACLKDIKAAGINLEKASIKRANASRADFTKAVLEEINAEEAQLVQAILKAANMRHAKIKKANLEEADVELTDLFEVEFDKETNLKNLKNLDKSLNASKEFVKQSVEQSLTLWDKTKAICKDYMSGMLKKVAIAGVIGFAIGLAAGIAIGVGLTAAIWGTSAVAMTAALPFICNTAFTCGLIAGAFTAAKKVYNYFSNFPNSSDSLNEVVADRVANIMESSEQTKSKVMEETKTQEPAQVKEGQVEKKFATEKIKAHKIEAHDLIEHAAHISGEASR
jgi:uncharacterized protein YjbI with pentapeptide repeats